jgi:hypothetical protein
VNSNLVKRRLWAGGNSSGEKLDCAANTQGLCWCSSLGKSTSEGWAGGARLLAPFRSLTSPVVWFPMVTPENTCNPQHSVDYESHLARISGHNVTNHC